MSGLYIHIPFCKQACHYCNFHFSTSLRYKNELLLALLREMELRKDYLSGEKVNTIYIGGGTPSLLEIEDCRLLIERIHEVLGVEENAEITLEANPDDINREKLEGWKKAGINRLSIGVQSFYNEDLQWMNRAHDSSQATACLRIAKELFDNITIDLIYGTPGLTNEKWKKNVETAISFNIPHLSCYALTVEPKTPLQKMILQHKTEDINPDKQSEQFLLLMQWMEEAGYEHYEISNYAKPGFRSRHNSSYWQGKKYIGIGPSSHSFNGDERQWNVSNNSIYTQSIQEGNVPFEKEELTTDQRVNEYIMTSLRTVEGLQLQRVTEEERNRIEIVALKYLDKGWIKFENDSLVLTKEGKLFADGIAAELFR